MRSVGMIRVDGGNGDDKLYGGDGNDTLIDGKGGDKLHGGPGQDSFLFRDLESVDGLKDFTPVDDTILLDHSKFSRIPLGVLSASQLTFGGAAADADDRIMYNSANGKLYYDSDGSGPTHAIQFAKLAAGLALTAGDLVVV